MKRHYSPIERPDLVTFDQAAFYVSVSIEQLKEWVGDGKLRVGVQKDRKPGRGRKARTVLVLEEVRAVAMKELF